jgi:putative hemolysin
MPLATDHFLRQAVDRRAAVLAMPPHIKAYLRLGGQVGEGAYLDAAFGCIDVCMVIDTAALPARSRAIYSAPAP